MDFLDELKWDLKHDRWSVMLFICVWLLLWWLVLPSMFVRFCWQLWEANRFMFVVTSFNVGVATYLLTLMVLDYSKWLDQFICN